MTFVHIVSALALACAFIPVESAKATTELEQRAAISASVEEKFQANDFAQLENMSRQFRTEKSRTASGLWNLSLFYASLDGAIKNQSQGEDRDASFEAIEGRIREWASKFPESPTAHIAHSQVLIERAWAHRGSGYARSVKPEAWAPFEHYIAMAKANLEKFKSVASVDPKWYEVMMLIARAENWARSEFDALLNAALEREPLFYQTYFSALQYLLPKWHGDIQEIEDFAQDAVARTRNQEGFGMYARIYWFASQTQFKNDIFNNSLVEWSQMKEGFEDVISRYPDAWNLNNYARFACLAGDKPKTMELLRRIESSVIAEAWVPLLMKGRCAHWAFQP
jgi:hypothetical protein